jgi:hypothetical protein
MRNNTDDHFSFLIHEKVYWWYELKNMTFDVLHYYFCSNRHSLPTSPFFYLAGTYGDHSKIEVWRIFAWDRGSFHSSLSLRLFDTLKFRTLRDPASLFLHLWKTYCNQVNSGSIKMKFKDL